MKNNQKIESNRKNWNESFEDFKGWCALPTWGPFEVCKNIDLLGDIKGKVFLEICCGSGHSVQYLLNKGAKKVYALDFSEQQLNLAKELNIKDIESGRAVFFHSNMEEKIEIPELVDIVFSIYGIGWTFDPVTTFSNIFSYLKKDGKFIWSWDHPIFRLSKVIDNEVIVKYSYHDEIEISNSNKVFKDNIIYFTPRKVSTWHTLLVKSGFLVEEFIEPKPLNIKEDISSISSPDMAKYYDPLKAEKLPITMIFKCSKK